MMRHWRTWWERLVWLGQYDPPRFVESLMLVLAMVLLGVWQVADSVWGIDRSWAYLVFSLSYAGGSALSILVRETLISSSHNRLIQFTALVLLLTSTYVFVCVFTDLSRYLLGMNL